MATNPQMDPEFQSFAHIASKWVDEAINQGGRSPIGHTFQDAWDTGAAGGESPQEVAAAWILGALADPTFPGSQQVLDAIIEERLRQKARLEL